VNLKHPPSTKIFWSGFFLLLSSITVFSFSIVIGPPPQGSPLQLPPPDTTPPNVSITSPSEGFMVTTPDVVIQGTASDPSGVRIVAYSVDRPDGAGFGQSAMGTTSWIADIHGLAGGTNTVQIRAWDSLSNLTEVTIHIYFFQQTPLTVLINGGGTVKPNLNGIILETGKPFSMTEKPDKGFVFAGWTGDITSSDATLSPAMRSNMVLQASFVPTPFIPAVGKYEGVITPVVSGPLELGGSFKAVVSSKGKFSAKLQLGDKMYPLVGTFLADGSYSSLIRRRKHPNNPVKVQLQLDVGTQTMSGIITDFSWSASPTGSLSATIQTR
jgi:hypothetical protein